MTAEPDWASDAEQNLLSAALPAAARLGWTSRLIAFAAKETGLSTAEAELLLPHGPADLAALLSRRHDARALAALSRHEAATMKVRERIRLGVLARCDAAMADEAAVRRWCGFLALPNHVPLGLRLLWASADGIWRWAGDTATDENHYSKRVLLAEILFSTLAITLSSSPAAAQTHLDRRIEAVMAFEGWKARARRPGLGENLAARLGRWRYRPAGRGSAAASKGLAAEDFSAGVKTP